MSYSMKVLPPVSIVAAPFDRSLCCSALTSFAKDASLSVLPSTCSGATPKCENRVEPMASSEGLPRSSFGPISRIGCPLIRAIVATQPERE
jgi:hypothetical protein